MDYGEDASSPKWYYLLAATLRGSRPGVQSAPLYDNFGKPGNYVITKSLMTS